MLKRLKLGGIFLGALQAVLLIFLMAACAQQPGPQLGQKAAGPVIDKSGDARLQELIKTVEPEFRQAKFTENGKTMPYSLFTPKQLEPGKKYPLVLFMADASTAGQETTAPLSQGYGALLFASPEAQAKNPCFVLVPQFSGVAVNDAYEHTPEADIVLKLVENVAANNAIDPKRLYTTGQSMGGMLSMYFMASKPEIFAAGLFVDCHWNPASLDALVEHPFIFVYAGTNGKAYKCEQAIEEAARKMSRSYAWAEWSARLPQQTQDDLAANLLGKGNPINLAGFENRTVLPENGQGSEHMYSFDKAYQITPFREWLFGQSLK